MKNKFLVIVAVAMVLSMIYIWWNNSRAKYAEVMIGGTALKVEVADTIGKQTKGLSGRKNLGADEGMLFPMGLPNQYTFWMKNMNFPIDIIWVRDGKVVDITENLLPPGKGEQPASASPKESTDAVLEVNAGFVKEHGIQIGDEVRVGI